MPYPYAVIDEQTDILEQLEDINPEHLPLSRGFKGDLVYENALDPLVEFFSKAGNFSPTQSYHGKTVTILDLFRWAWIQDEYRSMQLAMWMRDCRGGAGNRSGFRSVIRWISAVETKWMLANIHFVPQVGRWDDLITLLDTPCEERALSLWTEAILKGDGLACKWAPRENKNKEVFHKLRKFAKLSPSEFRKHLAFNTQVVENDMCNNDWEGINYNHVPSVAMARLTNAFAVRDTARFDAWKETLADADSGNKINASVLFPHDCIRTLRSELGNEFHGGHYGWSYVKSSGTEKYEDSLVANAQFAALPDFMGDNKMRIMPICDFSASMTIPISKKNTIQLIDVCMGLGLYCSDRVGKENPFYRKFMPFSNDARLVSWKDETFSVAVQKYNDGFCGSTNIQAALDRILESAILFGATDEQMPNCLLVISDMQWDCSVDGNGTAVEDGMRKWEEKGFKRPRIVYWNLNRYSGQPATIKHKDVALASGYSPSILKAICTGEDFTPVGIMERAISKYEIIRPE